MQNGWECQRCHNIYSPATPFCLYCWFQNNNKIQNIQIKKNDNIQKQEQNQQSLTTIKQQKANTTAEKDIYSNKTLELQLINITIPSLSKTPDGLISNTYPDTEIYLGGIGHAKQRAINRQFKIPYILDSIIDLPIVPSKLVRKYFDYLKSNNIKYLLDSGAFSYMNNPKKAFSLKDHLKQYCYYINEFDIQNFFELDLDVFMSLSEVENIRKKIYQETHKKPIIVYHPKRGKDYWLKMCKENSFIAIGDLVTGTGWDLSTRDQVLCEMCDEAHSYKTLVHGLGYTPLKLLNTHTMPFDTVDSTSWNFTLRGANAALNEKGELIKIPPIGTFSTIESQEIDLKIWAKFATDYRGGKKS